MHFAVETNARPLDAPARQRILDNPGFGIHFTDNMVRIDYFDGAWHGAEVLPFEPIALSPGASVFHYGQAIFEGLKAYCSPDGSIATFRPDANARRFANSARRMGMPSLPEEVFIESVDELVRTDRDWVPARAEHSLYLRPLMIATQVGLAVNAPSNSYRYYVIASPAGAYFADGVHPVAVWASTEYTRAAPGGTGEAKCGGNYGAAFVGQMEAVAHGCDQVVWLDAREHRWVEEMGGMNLCFVFGSGPAARVVTPPLTGTLLPGITRDSVLTLAADLGYAAEERRVSLEEWQAAASSGDISESFACGTAAVITPVGSVRSPAGSWLINGGVPGPVTMQLRERLVGIQTGLLPDAHGWVHPVVPATR